MVYELPRAGQQEALSKYASGSRWMQLGEKLFHDMKHSPVASFLLVDVLGLFFSAALLGKTLFRRPFHWVMKAVDAFFRHPFETEIRPGDEAGEQPHVRGVPEELARGYSIQQQADFIEGGLRMIGLTENFGRFVVLCGHGSTTDNNPYSAALDCGACGGRHGDPNARTLPRWRTILWCVLSFYSAVLMFHKTPGFYLPSTIRPQTRSVSMTKWTCRKAIEMIC